MLFMEEDKRREVKKEREGLDTRENIRENVDNADEVLVEMEALNHIYTPLEEAKEEIWRRWNDKRGQSEIDKSRIVQ